MGSGVFPASPHRILMPCKSRHMRISANGSGTPAETASPARANSDVEWRRGRVKEVRTEGAVLSMRNSGMVVVVLAVVCGCWLLRFTGAGAPRRSSGAQMTEGVEGEGNGGSSGVLLLVGGQSSFAGAPAAVRCGRQRLRTEADSQSR
ncbi:hypothetical protein K7X08_023064 [Anisodus acutangulus]|uniref:Uncharacterized protein n=1 Tax=Anisodus acutangulus TaxID=402998 RepID=A0A9Q1MCG1_9SOLA|nr:hypothetical protein K7X08_023064 [Anisodus acutangulus]